MNMDPLPTIGSRQSTRATSQPPLARKARVSDTDMSLNSIEHLERDLQQTQLDNLKLHSQLRDAQAALKESQAASVRNIAAQEKRVRGK